MATYEELREKYTENALSAALIAKGYSKEDIMKMEFAYKKAKGLIEYPKKNATVSNFTKDFVSGFGEGLTDKATNYKKAIEEGYNESNVGMMTNKRVPETSSDFSLDEQVVKSISGIVSDAPVFATGSLVGTGVGGLAGGMIAGDKGAVIGGAIGGSAGAFALEDGLRSLLIQYYKNGEATSFSDFVYKISDVDFLEVFQEGAKGAVVGAVLHGANVKASDLKKWIIEKYGKDATKTKIYNTAVDTLVPTTALTASSSLLNRELPTIEDFIHAGMTIAGLHLITKSINPVVKKISEKTKNIAVSREENKAQSINSEVVDIQEQGGQLNPYYNGYKFTIDVDTKPSQYWTNYLMEMYVEYGLHPKDAVVSYRENPFSLFPKKDGQSYMIWSGEKLPVEYKVVEAKDLKTSHDAQGNRNNDYPEYMQNRERDRKSSQEQINTIASNFMPELSIYGIEPQTGAPVITQEGFVISGNGRVEAIKLAKEKGTQGDYRAIAEDFDINAKDMENPIIVRVLKGEYSEEQIRDLVQKGNQSTTLKLSKSETARDDATKLDDSLLDRLDTTTELSSIENRGFIDEALNKIIPQNEKASLLDKDGKITNEGINRINNALLANIIKDNGMLSKMIETEDVVLKKVSSGLAKSSPTISKMEKDIQNGLVNEDYSLVKDINEALNLYDKFKKSNMTFNEFMKQGDMFNEVSPSVAELTRIFQSSKGANVIKDIINDYSNVASESSGGFNFDIPEMTKADILKEAYGRRVKKNSEGFSNPENLLPAFDETKPENYFVANKDGNLAHGYISGVKGYDDGEIRVYNGLLVKSKKTKPKEGMSRMEQLSQSGEELLDFIDDVANNYNKIYKGTEENSLLLIKIDKKNKGVAIKLEKNPNGKFYKVTSAYFVRDGYLVKKSPVEEAPSPRQLEKNVDQPRISDTGADLKITSQYEKVKMSELKNDEFTDTMFGGSAENVKVGNLEQSDIYRGDKSQINVSYSGEGVAVSRHTIADRFKQRIQNLAEVGNIPYRKGKMYVKGSILGFYNPRAEVIRTRGIDDLSTLVHETAHHLDKVLFKDNQTITKGEEKIFFNELDKIASKGDPLSEGFAEFVSHFVTNPEFVQKNTPKFYKHFMEFMKENEPEILKILEETQKDYKAYREQSSNKRIEGLFATDNYEGRNSFKRFLDNLYTDYVDDLYPLKVLEKEVLKIQKQRNPKANVKLMPSKSPYILARLNRGVKEKINQFLVDESVNIRLERTGKSLKALYDGLTPQEIREFDVYLASKRALVLNKRGIETGIGSKDAMETVKNLAPKYETRSQEVYKYIENLRQYLVDSGMVSEARAIIMKQLDPFYVPYKRVVNKEDRAIARRLNASQVVKRIKGSDRQLLPIQESLAEYTVRVIANADKNMIMQSIADLSQLEGSGKFIERVPSKKPIAVPKGSMLARKNDGRLKGNSVELVDPDSGDSMGIWDISEEFWVNKPANKNVEITVLRDGEPYVYEVTPELAKLVNGLNPQEIGWVANVLSPLSSTLRAGSTLTPEFAIKNLIRDTMEAFINSRGEGFTPFIDNAKAISGILKNNPEYRDWKVAGGKMASFIPTDRKNIQKIIKNAESNVALMDKTGYLGKALNTINPLNIARAWSEISEDSTRFGVYGRRYNYLKNRGWDDYNSKLGAAFSSREATIDFARIGAKMRGLNAVNAFLNAGFQGADKMARNIIKAPVRTAKAIGVLALASVYFSFAGKDDEDIKELNQTIKDENWIYRASGGLRKIPKPQNAIPFLSVFERALESTSLGDYFDRIEDGFADRMQLNVLGLIPDALQPIVEGWRNKSNYTNVPLIPAWQERLMPEYQYVEATTETSKWLSRQLAGLFGKSVSPILIDQAVRDWAGGLGIYGLQLSDYVSTGSVKQDIYEYEHTPFFRAFRIAYPTRGNSQSYTEFMKASENIERKYNTAKYALEKGERTPYERYLVTEYILEYRRAIINLGREQKAISDNPNLSIDVKRTKTDKIIRAMIKLSKQGNDLIASFEKNEE